METDLIQDGGQVKRQTDIDHHGPKYILIICHLPDPPIFSLPTTFKLRFSSVQNYLFILKMLTETLLSIPLSVIGRWSLVSAPHWLPRKGAKIYLSQAASV